MSKFKSCIAIITILVLGGGSLMASGATVDDYKVTFGEARWQTKYNNFIDWAFTGISNLSTLITNWAPVENQDILIPVAATYSAGTTFTVPGNYTSRFVANAKVRVDLGSGTLKGSYVASSSYATGTTTVILHDSILTNPIAGVWLTATRNGLWPNGPGYVVAADYGSNQAALEQADALAAAAGKELVITGSWTVATGYTFTSVLTVQPGATLNLNNNATFSAVSRVMPGATLAIATGKTLTISKAFEAGLYQVFSCTGTGKAVFGPGAVIQAYPEWWGANTTPGTTDLTTAIQAAINSLSSGIVQLQATIYSSATLYYKANITVRGKGAGKTIIKLKAAQNTPIFSRSDAYMGDNYPTLNALAEMTNVVIEEMTLDGNQTNQTLPPGANDWDWMILLQRASGSRVSNCKLVNGRNGGIILQQCKDSIVENNILDDVAQSGSLRNGISTCRNFTGGVPSTYINAAGGNKIIGNTVYIPVALRSPAIGYAISSEYTTNDIIANNVSHYGAIGAESNINVTITGNIIYGAVIQGGDTGHIGFTGCLVSGNQLYSPYFDATGAGYKNCGIGFTDVAGLIITDNTIIKATHGAGGGGAAFCQILVNACPGAKVSNNQVLQPDTAFTNLYGLVLYNSPSVSVYGNTFETYGAAAIVLQSTAGYENSYYSIKNNRLIQTKIATPRVGVGVYIADVSIQGIVEGNYVQGFYALSQHVATVTSGYKTLVCNNRLIDLADYTFGEITRGDIISAISSRGLVTYFFTAAPTTGTWSVGDRTINTAPAVGQPKSWVCTVAGTPGTWVSEGNL